MSATSTTGTTEPSPDAGAPDGADALAETASQTTVDHRLTTRQMAEFVAQGFLRFDALVPDDVNRRGLEQMAALEMGRFLPDGPHPPTTGTPISACYPAPSAIGDYLRLPAVAGIIDSLVGPEAIFDHDWTHHLKAGDLNGQHLHVDAIADSADPTFDVQLFWFPHEVKPGEGGTRFVPGSHLRRVRADGMARYQRVVGEKHYSGPAGTVLVFHHGLWHAGQPHAGDTDRWMHKIRLNPTVAQVKQWNCDDLVSMQNEPSDHVFATMADDTVAHIFRRWHPWHGVTDYRNDQMARARLWRYLSGDPTYDVDYYLTRLEGRSALKAPATSTPDPTISAPPASPAANDAAEGTDG